MRWFVLLSLFLSTSAQAQTDGPLEFAEVDPVLVGGMEALQGSVVYPEADYQAGTEGRVLVRFVVNAEGVPEAVEVVRSVSAGLDSASVAAIRAARFAPGTSGGEAVSVRLVLPVTFRISRPEAPVAKPSVATLTAGLGRPCCGVPADSGAVNGGTGTLLWRAPEAGVALIEARVWRDTLRAVTIAYPAGAPSPIEALARQIAETRVRPGDDGFVLARDLAGRGMVSATDVRLDASRNRLTLRHPICHAVAGAGCYTVFPAPAGGIGALQSRMDYPEAARRARTGGTVVVAFVVQADGSVTDARVVSSTATGPGGEELAEAAAAAVRRSRWVLPPGKGPVPYALPLSFNIR